MGLDVSLCSQTKETLYSNHGFDRPNYSAEYHHLFSVGGSIKDHSQRPKNNEYQMADSLMEKTVQPLSPSMYESRVTSITRSGVTTNTNSYNGLDTRYSTTDSAGTKTFKRAGAGVLAPVLGDGSAVYTPGISERRSSTTTYMHPGIKSGEAQSSTSQVIAATRQYDAFGNLDSSTGTWKGPFGYGGAFGYQETGDHGLRLLGHRYYDSSTGRFLTRDSIKDGRNWYGYCGNSPSRYVDPAGHKWHDPMQVYVHPSFRGRVIGVGETGPRKEQSFVHIPPGFVTDHRMDIDYLVITYPDGKEVQVFLMGLATEINPKNESQFSWIDHRGKVHSQGPVLWGDSLFSFTWLPSLGNGLQNPTSKRWHPKPRYTVTRY